MNSKGLLNEEPREVEILSFRDFVAQNKQRTFANFTN